MIGEGEAVKTKGVVAGEMEEIGEGFAALAAELGLR